MIEYKYLNANPNKNETNDCVIRAIAIYDYFEYNLDGVLYEAELFNIYDKVYKMLFDFGIGNYLMINDERNYRDLLKYHYRLEEINFDKNKVKVKDLKPMAKCMLVNLNGHLTVMIDNTILDTFDCREEYVESVFYY